MNKEDMRHPPSAVCLAPSAPTYTTTEAMQAIARALGKETIGRATFSRMCLRYGWTPVTAGGGKGRQAKWSARQINERAEKLAEIRRLEE